MFCGTSATFVHCSTFPFLLAVQIVYNLSCSLSNLNHCSVPCLFWSLLSHLLTVYGSHACCPASSILPVATHLLTAHPLSSSTACCKAYLADIFLPFLISFCTLLVLPARPTSVLSSFSCMYCPACSLCCTVYSTASSACCQVCTVYSLPCLLYSVQPHMFAVLSCLLIVQPLLLAVQLHQPLLFDEQLRLLTVQHLMLAIQPHLLSAHCI